MLRCPDVVTRASRRHSMPRSRPFRESLLSWLLVVGEVLWFPEEWRLERSPLLLNRTIEGSQVAPKVTLAEPMGRTVSPGQATVDYVHGLNNVIAGCQRTGRPKHRCHVLLDDQEPIRAACASAGAQRARDGLSASRSRLQPDFGPGGESPVRRRMSYCILSIQQVLSSMAHSPLSIRSQKLIPEQASVPPVYACHSRRKKVAASPASIQYTLRAILINHSCV